MKTTKNWFEVDTAGLRQLQEGKPITHLIRELVQNALDEPITKCEIRMTYKNRIATIEIEDDSPVGFRDLSDAWTLFKQTYKRSDVKKRGRFNLGEKQVFAMCRTAEILTTTGGVRFDSTGRKTLRKKREKGSLIIITINLKRIEFDSCVSYCKDILIPEGIELTVSAEQEEFQAEHKVPYKVFPGSLKTEVLIEDKICQRTRETEIRLHKESQAMIYEMGLPVCPINCTYSVDIQQKIPMSADRDKVGHKYLNEVYGLVLNNMHEEIEANDSSNAWIRSAITSDAVEDDTVRDIVTKRFGDKAVIDNPFDAHSRDEAISKGYNVVMRSELDSNERAKLKDLDLLPTSTSLFGATYEDYKLVDPTNTQIAIGEWIKKVAQEFLNINLEIVWLRSKADIAADYGNSTIRFNLHRISKDNWTLTQNRYIDTELLDLVIHELGHSKGMHYEHSYHECLTMLGSKLTTKSLLSPEWFVIK